MWRKAEVEGAVCRVVKLMSSVSTLAVSTLAVSTLAVAVLAVAVLAYDAPLAGQEEPALRDGLGDHHFAVSTQSEAAQTWFDQGFRLTYAFEHAEAVAAFRRVTELDPG